MTVSTTGDVVVDGGITVATGGLKVGSGLTVSNGGAITAAGIITAATANTINGVSINAGAITAMAARIGTAPAT